MKQTVKYPLNTYFENMTTYGLCGFEAYCYHMLLLRCLTHGHCPGDLDAMARVCKVKKGDLRRVWKRISHLFEAIPEGYQYIPLPKS